MSRILRYLACLFTLFFVGNALAAGYSCPDYKKYTNCNPGYYLSNCGSYRDGRTVNPTVGNSCKSCPSGYECDGNTRCPYVNEVTITYNLNGGSGSAPSAQTCTPGESCSLASGATTSFYRAGYVFVGWSTRSTSTSGFSSLTFSADATVYAVWNKCSAGTYKPGSGTQASALCSACSGRTKYSGAGAAYCSTVRSGYYTTGCNSSGNKCTGQSQCTGATYCTGGEQKSCPAETSGWTRGTGTGWSSYSQCYQTKDATIVSSYCSAGQLQQNGASATTWGTAKVSTTFQADPGAYVTGTGADTTCSRCTSDYYCPGGTTTRQSCSSLAGGFYPNSVSGSTSAEACYTNSISGKYVADSGDSSATSCAAGTYKGSHTVHYGDTSSCNECQNYEYSSTGASSCTAVRDGYYATGCDSSGNGCTGREPCSGANWCSDGVLHSCPTADSGWTLGEGSYWDTYTDCYEYRNATSISSYCASGRLVRSADSASDYEDTATESTAFEADPGAYLSGSGIDRTCSRCPSGYRDGDGADSEDDCVGEFRKYGHENTPAMQTGCAERELGTCSPGSCTYTKRHNGTIISDCTPSNCTKPQTCTSASTNYYLDENDDPERCPDGYPNSAGGSGGVTQCYSDTKSRPWTGRQVNGTTPTNCYSATWGSCRADQMDACSYVAYANAAGTGDGTIKSGCLSNSANCTKQVASVTAKSGYFDAGTYCSACPDAYPNSANGNDGGNGACYMSVSGGHYVADAHDTATATCAAGTYKGSHTVYYGDTSSCSACSGQNQYQDATGQSSCKTVGDGYYKVDNTERAQCSGAYWCSDGVLHSCPTADSGWTLGEGTGWSSYSQCYQTKNATSVSSYCSAGQLQQNGASATKWGTATVSTTFQADPGAYVTGTGANTTCTQCEAGYACPGGTAARDACDAQTEYQDATGQTSCKTVGSGYYKVDNTEQEQCMGAYWCSGGVRNSCPDQTSGWTRGTGTGWTSYTDCYQTRAATAASTYCSAGILKQNATSATAWGATTVSSALSAKAGAYVNGTTCSQCTGATYSAGGRATTCSTCPSIYTDNTTSGKKAITECQVITDGGYYIAANNDAEQTECPGANYCPSATVNYGLHNSPTACPVATEHVRTSYPDDYYDPTFVRITNQNWSKKLDAITDCSANYTLTNDRGTFSVETVHYDATTEEYSSGGSKYYTKVNPGYYVQNRLSATYCDTGTNMLYKDAEPCPANSYCPGMTSMPACSSGEYTETNGINSCPANYGTSPAMSDAATDCYLTTTAKNFVATPNAAQTTCTAGGYCVGGVKVNYGSTGGRTPAARGYYVSTTGATTQTPCEAGTYTSSTGQTKCTDAAAGTYTTGCQITSNNTACTGTAVCATNKYSDARASVCISCNTADGYGNSGTTAASHAGQASCKVTCSGGQYVPTAGGGCVNVGVGYWGDGGTVSETATLARNSCEFGLTTIGSGAGADEAGDCGRVLNIGSQKIYLRSEKKTDRALNVDINGNVFYGNMSTTIDGPLKINYNGTTYSVYDDSME